jgi:RNA polymerase sigma factor (sigma-70 family)
LVYCPRSRAADTKNTARPSPDHFTAISVRLVGAGGAINGRSPSPVRERVDAVPIAAPDSADAVDVIAVDRALKRLEEFDPDQARIVELRFLAGMTVEETADVVGVSPASVKREWAVAKAWLYQNLTGRQGESAQ